MRDEVSFAKACLFEFVSVFPSIAHRVRSTAHKNFPLFVIFSGAPFIHGAPRSYYSKAEFFTAPRDRKSKDFLKASSFPAAQMSSPVLDLPSPTSTDGILAEDLSFLVLEPAMPYQNEPLRSLTEIFDSFANEISNAANAFLVTGHGLSASCKVEVPFHSSFLNS